MRRENWEVLENRTVQAVCKYCYSKSDLRLVSPPKRKRLYINLSDNVEIKIIGIKQDYSEEMRIYLPNIHVFLTKLKIRKIGIPVFCLKCETYSIICPHCNKDNDIKKLKQRCEHCTRKFYFPRGTE